jgi:tetratricopeptide (TPR) repeat protein
MDDDKKKLINFNSSILDDKNDDIYSIVSKSPGYSVKMQDNTILILNILVSSKICTVKAKRLLIELISKSTGIEIKAIKIIIDFILSLKLVETLDENYILSPYGKLFLMSDSTSQQVDILRYFWERADWNKIVPENSCDKFIHRDARRYVACMLSRINSEKLRQYEEHNAYRKDSDNNDSIIFKADFNAYKELLTSKSIKYLLQNIFEPLGLLAYDEKSNMEYFKLSQRGKQVFEYYSYGMVDEYKSMIDECWDSYDRGNFQEAFDNALSIIKVAGIIPEALNVIGCVFIKKNEYIAAENIFNFALDICSNNAMDTNIKNGFYAETYISVYYNLGLCCVSMGEYFRALHIFSSIKKTVPYNIESLEEVEKEVRKLVVIA